MNVGYDGAMHTLRPLIVVALLAASSACHKGPKGLDPAAIEASAAAIVEDNDQGTAAWIVGPDGNLSALLKGVDGKVLLKNVTGQITFGAGASARTVPVVVDEKTGVLTAAGPKLEADLTPVHYALSVDGKPWTGTLAVPPGGTAELAETAKLQATLPAGKLGPHGGAVQLVGPDRVELIADKGTGETRVYVLDADFKAIDPGDRKITIALQGDDSEVVVLSPEPKGHYVMAKVAMRGDPARVTVVVSGHGVTHACVVGWAPGAHIVVGSRAPRVKIFIVSGWDRWDHVDVDGPDHGHGHWKEHDDDDFDGKLKVDVKGKGGGLKIHVH